MPRIQVIQDLSKVDDQAQFMRNSSQIHQQTVDAINGNLEFDKNIKSETVVVEFKEANVDTAVPHNLGKKNVNYLKGKQSIAMSIYDGVRPATNAIIYLRSDVPGTVTLVLY